MAWVSPTGFEDPESGWSNEPNAYDESLSTWAVSGIITEGNWCEFLILTHTALDCSKVRIYPDYGEEPASRGDIDLDVHWGEVWHHIHQGAVVNKEWNEFELGGTYSVDALRIRQYARGDTEFIFREADFWEEAVLHERTFTDGLKVGDALVKTPMKMLLDGIALSDVLIKNPIKVFTDAIKFTDVVEKVYIRVRTFVDGIALTDTLIKSIAKVLTDGISFTDVLKKLWIHGVLRILTAIRNLPSVREEGTKR